MEGTRNRFGEFFKGFTLEKIPSFLLMFAIFLSPIFFVPSKFFPPQFSKSVFIFTLILLAFFFLLMVILREGKFTIPTNLVFLSVIILPLVFLIASMRIGKNFIPSILPQSIFGYGFEVGTFAFILLMSILVYTIIGLIKTKEKIFKAQTIFLSSLIVVIIFQIIFLVALNLPQSIATQSLSFLSFGVFTTSVSNLVGSWNDLGVFFAVGVLLSLITLETISLNRLFKIFVHVALWASLCFLVIIGFTLLWEIIAVFSLILFVYLLSVQKISSRLVVESRGNVPDEISKSATSKIKKIPGLVATVFIVSIVFTALARLPIALVLTGGDVGVRIATFLHVPNIEVRPSWGATFEIARHTLVRSPIVGSGPNRFLYEWLTYKPDGINATQFWNTDFNYGVGLIPTFVVTTGILGILAWLFFFGTFVATGLKAIFSPANSDPVTRYVYLSSFVPAIFLWTLAVTYVPGIVIITLAFFFTGLFIAAAIFGKVIRSDTFVWNKRPRTSFLTSLAIVIIIVLTAAFTHNMFTKSVSAFFFQKSAYAYKVQGNSDFASVELNKAMSLNSTDLYYRTSVDIDLYKMGNIIASKDSSAPTIKLFGDTLTHALASGNLAIVKDPVNYQNWLSVGSIYEALIPLKIKDLDAYGQAVIAYDKALALNPKSPFILITRARLEAKNGDYKKAKDYIGKAITLKRDYTDAIFLLSQIQVSEGNVKDAIISVKAAIGVSPNDPALYFRLGLLDYNVSNFQETIIALEKAVKLAPNYSNAKYFLGLSYYKVGRVGDAILEFQDIQKLNPDNKEIPFILANLKAGRDPFANAKPPVDNKPEQRSTLPVSDKSQ